MPGICPVYTYVAPTPRGGGPRDLGIYLAYLEPNLLSKMPEKCQVYTYVAANPTRPPPGGTERFGHIPGIFAPRTHHIWPQIYARYIPGICLRQGRGGSRGLESQKPSKNTWYMRGIFPPKKNAPHIPGIYRDLSQPLPNAKMAQVYTRHLFYARYIPSHIGGPHFCLVST